MNGRQYDIIVFGASSFVGRILCQYLHQHCGELSGKWAMAGRSQSRLEQLRNELGATPAQIPLIIVDAADAAGLVGMCRQTRVVVSTVGPYALHGEALIKACAETGIDYCDLSGEVQWIRRMISRYDSPAAESGARIVNCCGFDSLPSDLGVHFLQSHALQRFGTHCTRIKMRVHKLKGGASGGTIASMLNVAREAAADPDLRRELADPYSLCPSEHALKARQHAVTLEYDDDLHSWAAPFIMSGINTRVVHRSHALSGAPWGSDFCYDEAMLTGDGPAGKRRAKRLGRALQIFMLAVVMAPSRWLLLKFLPSPGQGPSPQMQENGCFDLLFVGRTEEGQPLYCRVTGKRDPGYGATARMLAQAALCLVHDVAAEKPGGFWTPATLFGDALIERLRQHADIDFEIIDAPPRPGQKPQ